MKKRKISQKIKIAAIWMVMTAVSLTSCGLPGLENAVGSPIQEDATLNQKESTERVDTGFILTGPNSYDSADTAILVDINKDDNTVSLLNLDIGRRYTLSVDGTTCFYDKYGESISLNQLEEGDVVDVTFLKSKKHLTTMQRSATAWCFEEMERYEINTVRNEVTIGKEIYKLTDNTQYVSDGINIEKMDLNPMDILTFQGIDRNILSIKVEKGHGYLRLVNDENFVGGWIEIGQKQIQRITDDMLLTVAEGSYQVNISHNGGGGIKSVIINRNEETTLDIGDLAVAEAKYGTVLFSLNPSDAKLYIDGSQVDPSQPISLEYGIHQIIAKADGYKSLTQYVSVGQESAGLDVILDAVDSDNDEEESSSEESSETASSEEATTNYYKVYIDAPEDAEVYLNGNYIGISPCSFKKTAGSHVVTIRKSGYETRSYTIQIDDEEKDISYSFANLEQSPSKSSEASSKEENDDSSTASSSASSSGSNSSTESASSSGSNSSTESASSSGSNSSTESASSSGSNSLSSST